MQKHDLEKLLHQEIPITQALGISVLQLNTDNIQISAPFENNKNIHNTAFAGSIYTTATLAAWSLMTLYAKQHNLQGAVVLAKGEIKYLRPINGDIIAYCELPNETEQQSFFKTWQQKNSGQMKFEVSIIEDDKVKAKFIGKFALVKKE